MTDAMQLSLVYQAVVCDGDSCVGPKNCWQFFPATLFILFYIMLHSGITTGRWADWTAPVFQYCSLAYRMASKLHKNILLQQSAKA